MTNLRLKSVGIRQTLDDQDLATKEIWLNDRNAFFDHAVTRSFRRTVIAIAKISK
jgi:hypothetical protein